jgi:hypothetical protein
MKGKIKSPLLLEMEPKMKTSDNKKRNFRDNALRDKNTRGL